MPLRDLLCWGTRDGVLWTSSSLEILQIIARSLLTMVSKIEKLLSISYTFLKFSAHTHYTRIKSYKTSNRRNFPFIVTIGIYRLIIYVDTKFLSNFNIFQIFSI